MKKFKHFILTALCAFCTLAATAQQSFSASQIIGLWSAPYKYGKTQGSLMVNFHKDHTVNITRSLTIEGVQHAAFIQRTGTWALNGSYIVITPGTEGELNWTREIANQIAAEDIDRYEANNLLTQARRNVPKLNALHFASKMQIRQASEDKLILLNPLDSQTLSFTRLSAYPSGRKLNLKPKTPIAERLHNEDQGTNDVTVVPEIKEEVIVEEKKPEPKNERIFTEVEESPHFPDGDAAMYRWLSQNIRYPEAAAQNGISGRVVVQFVVETDGSIGPVKVVRGTDTELDAEAVRLVKSFPKFVPGKMNGQPVRVWYTLPVNFKLH